MALLMPFMATGTLGLFWHALNNGALDHARTVAFTAMAVFQWFQASSARPNYQSIFSIGVFSNTALLWGVGSRSCCKSWRYTRLSGTHFLGRSVFHGRGL